MGSQPLDDKTLAGGRCDSAGASRNLLQAARPVPVNYVLLSFVLSLFSPSLCCLGAL